MTITSLSGRAKFDLATIVTAGVASSAFFLAAAWDFQRASLPILLRTDAPRLAAPAPAVDAVVATAVSLPAPRAARRKTRVAKPAPPAVRAKAEVKSQSRFARFLLGDGTETVQPFPSRQAER